MDKKEKKKLMTDVAKGKITMKEAEKMLESKTVKKKNKISPDFIGDDPETIREGTINPTDNAEIKSKGRLK